MEEHADTEHRDKLLFTPGPLTCSRSVKAAMLRDLGSRDAEFVAAVREVRAELLRVAGVGDGEFSSVLLQGSGTFCVEAALQTLVPREGGKVLLLVNGAYGRRMQTICACAGISADVLEFPEDCPVELGSVRARLAVGPVNVVCVVHLETSTGLLNPVAEVGVAVRELQPRAALLVDAMSSFGGVPLALDHVDVLVSSANKCLQGVPGLAFAIARTDTLRRCHGHARSLSLDLAAQEAGLAADGQFRFTPPTHALLALRQALRELREEGGVSARAARYRENCRVVQEGMADLGFRKLLSDPTHEGYIITSFRFPEHPNFSFEQFYQRLSDRGLLIYPGKVTHAACFRVGHIGALGPSHMRTLLLGVAAVVADMGVVL